MQPRPERGERLSQPTEIGEIRGRNNVEILRCANVAVGLYGHAPDHDVVNTVLAKHTENLLRVEDLIHRGGPPGPQLRVDC